MSPTGGAAAAQPQDLPLRRRTTSTGPATQRANVEAARDAGVNLAFFSGNEVFWKTRLEPSIDGVQHREPDAGHLQGDALRRSGRPAGPADLDGTWLDPRFSPPADGGRPQNALTGQLFVVNSGTTDITVPAQYGKLRFWRNTAVASLAAVSPPRSIRASARSATSGTSTPTTGSGPPG